MKLKSPKKTIILLTGIFYIVCLVLTMHLNLDEKITSMLPNSDSEVADFKYIINHVPAAENLYIQIETKTHDPETLKKAADSFYKAIDKSPFFTNIVYKFSNKSVMNLLDFVNKNKYWLFDKSDLNKIDSKITLENIQQLLPRIKKQLLEPGGMFAADQLTKDPLGLNMIILSKLAAFQAEASGVHISSSRIINKDGTRLLIIATPAFPAVDTQQSAKMFSFLTREKAKVTKAFENKIHLGFSGSHVATLDNSTTIQKDVQKAIIAMTLGILIIGFFFFGRFLYVLLIFLPTLVSLTFASALLSFFSHEISAIALGCGAVLLGITVDFGIHILFSVDNAGTAQTTKIISQLKRPIATGAATTMAAFSCLLFSSLPGQRQMGFFTITGILGAALFSVFILKYFILALPKEPKKPLISLVKACDSLMAFRKKHLFLVGFICLIAFGFSLTGLKNFKFEGDISTLNHLSPETQRDMDSFLSTWGKSSPSVILVKAKNLEQALEKNDDLFKLLKKMESQGKINQIASLADIFPSKAQRKIRYENFQKFLPKQRIDILEKTMAKAALSNGFSPNAFAPFFAELKAPKKPFTRRDFTPTVIEQLIKAKLIFEKDSVLALTTINVKDKSQIAGITAQIKSELPQARFLDNRHFIKKITDLVTKEFEQIFLFAAGAIILTLFIFLGRIKIILITITPVFLSAIMTAGIMGLAGISVNLISMLFIIFVFGVGVDFSIFLVHHELNKKPQDRQVTAGAVIICAMTTIGGFTCLAFAQHNALNSIGVAGLTGMLASLVLAMAIIPTLAEKFLTPGQTTKLKQLDLDCQRQTNERKPI
ncbi:MAG: MMPL family transporter [Desulfobacteraceae bacterium]|nr:MMPL family transporter [Desulfobacteraceae bacterium]